ncbi:MAG: metallophosphoesterase family protein [Chitinophagaceae bacterium]|nr:metallophosphoesterase family protein [Chitinophagaceae bacterium]
MIRSNNISQGLLPFQTMRNFIIRLLKGPVSKLANRYSSNPDPQRIYKALSELRTTIQSNPGKKGLVIPFTPNQKFIILSDQHKGAKDGSDDFANSEENYLAALAHYNQNNYHYIALGDCEELWENGIESVKKNNKRSFEAEKAFIRRNAFTKIFGNHDLYWDNDPFAGLQLQNIFGEKVCIYEGVILQTIINNRQFEVFITHGHQGDKVSDGNAFSKWFIANIWARLQNYLKINLNTPAYDNQLKTEHNKMMYEWSAREPDLILITGHTHQPVFQSLTYLERLYRGLGAAKLQPDLTAIAKFEKEIQVRQTMGEIMPDFTAYQPCYFNSGCCCFVDGDITGIEIEDEMIKLVKWKNVEGISTRILLEEMLLEKCLMQPIPA